MAAEPKTIAPSDTDDLRSFILGLDDSESELVTVAGWRNVTLQVKALTAAQRADFLKHCATPTKNGSVNVDLSKYWPDLVILTAYYPPDHAKAGERVFEPTDRDNLNRKLAKNLEAVADVARRLSGLGGESLEDAKSEADGNA